MTTQVSFTSDADLKKKALQKAKTEGITLKTVLIYSMKAYVEGKIHFGMMGNVEPEVEGIAFEDPQINTKAQELAKLLS